MGDYYRHFLTSMSGVEGYPPASHAEDLSPAVGPQISMPIHGGTAPPGYESYPTFGYIGGFPGSALLSGPKPTKGRRKTGAGHGSGTDHVKHRRTRSGCFMCRSRRVKCDETRPICERCKKGNRDCVYPDPPVPKGASGHGKAKEGSVSTQKPSPKSSNDGDEEEEGEEAYAQMEAVGSKDGRGESLLPGAATRQEQQGFGRGDAQSASSRDSQSQEGAKTSSPSASTAESISANPNMMQSFEPAVAEAQRDWSHLPPDFQHYLNYYVDNVTNYHYSLANDGDDFFAAILPSLAMQSEPLLYALVGFSAYHAMLENPNGQLHDFLNYYNRSVTLLLGCLKRKETNNVPILATILQLATMEEFLGDWVNLMGHQKAAFEIITNVFCPETVMSTAIGRTCLNWYSRYDNYVAIMGGFPTELPREWLEAVVEYCQRRASEKPEDMRWKIDDRSARLKVITHDMSMLFARGSREQMTARDFAEAHGGITQRLLDWKGGWDPALVDASYLVEDLSYRRPLGADDIVDPYQPGVLYRPPLLTTTLISAEWHSILMMHLSQSAGASPRQLFGELGTHAYAACQYFEAIELWPQKPKGSLISLQPCISIAALFLPQDMRHQMWIRRKFALLDMLGCIHPTTRRMKMAQVFGDASCARWWLPNDEGLTPMLRSLRAFADERNAAAVGAQQENIREVRHLFAKLETAGRDADAGSKGGGPRG